MDPFTQDTQQEANFDEFNFSASGTSASIALSSTQSGGVSTPLFFSDTNAVGTSAVFLDISNDQITSANAAKEYLQIEDSIWNINNVYNWSIVLSKIKNLEGKYDMRSDELEKAYRNNEIESLKKIDPQELKEWRNLITAYY